MNRFFPFVLIIAVLAFALGAGWYLKRKAVAPIAAVPSVNVNASPAAKPSGSIDPGANPPHALGPPDAPVTLEEFGDFECPPCGLLHPELKMIEREYGSRLRIIFREFPLVPTHAHALAAAHAAEAAGLQGKFWEMHDMLYENQKAWHDAFDVRSIFEGYATRIGLDLERFKKDNTNEIVELRIFLDGKRGHSLDVKGTPTVFLNGREVPFDSLAIDKFRALINAALASPRP
jgi:protein-disulfide isomerase